MKHQRSTWLLFGAVTGLVIAFATRWYWGAAAFLLLAAVTGAAYLGTGVRRVR